MEKAAKTASEVLAEAAARLERPRQAASSSGRWPTDHTDTPAALAERDFAERCSRCNDARILRYPKFAHGAWRMVAAWCSCKAKWISPEHPQDVYDSLDCSELWHDQNWLDTEFRRLRGELNKLEIEKHLAHGKRLRDLRGGTRCNPTRSGASTV